MSRSRKQHKSLDAARVVLSETAPTDMPIIFSQDGFYRHCKQYRCSDSSYNFNELFKAMIDGTKSATIPYSYKIFKNNGSLRTLSLAHPSWQYECIDFYQEYSDIICDLNSDRNNFSLRYPVKVASKSFYKDSQFDLNKYKKISNISTIDTELKTKHVTSFFSYKLRKQFMYFNSEEFFECEKKFSHLSFVDISKCFESIYTHTLLWSIKNKEYAKKHLSKKHHQFADKFDSHIRKAKHNETNGIIVGPEISRIFAEIILQEIDNKTLKSLELKNLIKGKDFEVRRYIDDYFIFSLNQENAELVTQQLKNELFKYNFHLNDAKSYQIERPFWTERSQAVHEVTVIWDNFFEKIVENKFFEAMVDGKPFKQNYQYPKKIWHYAGFKKKLFKDIKNTAQSRKNYTDIGNFSIGLILRRFLIATQSVDVCLSKEGDVHSQYYDLICCLLEVSFFLYSMTPTVPSSVNLSYLIVLTTRFSDKHMPEFSDSIKQRIYDLFLSFYEGRENQFPSEYGNADLEIINIILAIGDMGDEYLYPQPVIERIFRLEEKQTAKYFDIIGALYYIKDQKQFLTTRQKIEEVIFKKLWDCRRDLNKKDLKSNSEITFLILDSLTCPYLSERFKKFILYYAKNNYEFQSSAFLTAEEEIKQIGLKPWFVNWDTIDLLTLLQKSQLNTGYL
tara:strand:+ start:223632 stop:225656 length:2025 start_codon:yes stop_codon:yes gene_type:complete